MNVKLCFLDGLDRSGKSTLIKDLNKNSKTYIINKTLPSDKFRNSSSWDKVSKSSKKDWDKTFIVSWLDVISEDFGRQIREADEELSQKVLPYNYKPIILFDRGYISSIIYQLAMLTLHKKDQYAFTEKGPIVVPDYQWWKNSVASSYGKFLNDNCNYKKIKSFDVSSYVLTDTLKDTDSENTDRNNSDTDLIFEKDVLPISKRILKHMLVWDVCVAVRDLGSISYLGGFNEIKDIKSFKKSYKKSYNRISKALLTK